VKKLLLASAVLVAVLYGGYKALMFYDNGFRYGRMRETPAVRPYEEPLLVMETDLVPVDGGEKMVRINAGRNLFPPLSATGPDFISKGKRAYGYFCAQCHGKRLDGMGSVGQSFHPLPRDLRSRQVMDQGDDLLFSTISYGTKRMPPMATTVTVDDRRAVIGYIRSIAGEAAAVHSPVKTRDESTGVMRKHGPADTRFSAP